MRIPTRHPAPPIERTYHLTDAEYADALGVAFRTSLTARFINGDPDNAGELGAIAGTARARQIAYNRVMRPWL